MSIFEVQTIEQAPEGSKAPLEKLRQAFGMVPNVAGVIANSPVLANIFVPLFAGGPEAAAYTPQNGEGRTT